MPCFPPPEPIGSPKLPQLVDAKATAASFDAQVQSLRGRLLPCAAWLPEHFRAVACLLVDLKAVALEGCCVRACMPACMDGFHPA